MKLKLSSLCFHTLLLLIIIRLSKANDDGDDDVNYTHDVELLPNDRLHLHYRLDAFNFTTNSVMPLLLPTAINGTTTNSTSNANIISFKMTYKGSSWLSLGISPNNQGLMIGSQAVIGQPSQPNSVINPGKYYMFEYFEDGVVLRQMQEQNLINATISQSSDYYENVTTTILTFTKLINDDDISINVNGNQTFIYAVGGQDQKYPSMHDLSGSVTIDLSVASTSETMATTTTTAPTNRKSVFMAHAVLLSAAWGYLAPMAVGGSLFRQIVPMSWIKIHIYCNIVGFVLTLAGFIMVVVTRWNSNNSRWSHSHFILGWVMMCLVTIQIISGYLRPKADEPKDDDSTTKTGYVDRIRSGSIRALWELCHKLLGVSLLIAGIFQAFTGVNLMMPYGVNSSFIWLYWGGWIATIFVLGVFFWLSRKNKS